MAKTLTLDDVAVEHSAVPGVRPAKRVRASVGETSVELTVTFGAENGPRPEVTPEYVQAQLDATKDRARKEALWQEQVRLAVQNLV